MKKLDWYDFRSGLALARVDGGSAGVYYCENMEQYEEAIYRVVCHFGTGLYKVTYEEIPDGSTNSAE